MSELVSIIIPVYNGEKYIMRNLETVTDQSYQNLEIIYVDDGSSDGSADMIRSAMERDPRIRLITQTNHGVSYARNTGLKAATGTLITFADADDYVEPGYVETMVSTLYEEDADVACCGLVLHRSDKEIPLHADGEKQVWDTVQAQKQLLFGESIEPSAYAKIFRAEVIEGISFCVDIKYSEDYLWVLEAFQHCRKVAFRGEGTYHYIIHPNSATTNPPLLKMARDLIYVAETAAAMPVAPEIAAILDRKRLMGYLLNYNSLLYGKDPEIKEMMQELRQKVLAEKQKYRRYGMTKREQFFYYGITRYPRLYRYLFRAMKRILPDRRTFKL